MTGEQLTVDLGPGRSTPRCCGVSDILEGLPPALGQPDGVLGNDFLRRFVAHVDVAGGRLLLRG